MTGIGVAVLKNEMIFSFFRFDELMELVVCILRVFSRKIEINNGADLCLSADIGIDAVKKIDDVLPLLRRRFGTTRSCRLSFP